MNISIVIVHYNTPQILEDCLDSLYKFNKEKVSFEVIIVDNKSVKIFNENYFLSKYKNITFIYNQENLGFSKANNIGAKEAIGEYLFFLNSDTIFINPIFLSLLTFYKDTNKIGILGPRLLNTDRTTQYYGSVLAKRQYLGDKPRKVNFLSGAAMFIKRDLFFDVSGFDENYFFYNEDLDLCKTIKRFGYVNYYHPEINIIHIGGASTVLSKKLKKQSIKGSLYYLRKFYFIKNKINFQKT
jgi:GT2 family glycosyltransferase